MKCPTCGAAELVHDIRDVTYTYKGESTVIQAGEGDFCAACDEYVLNADISEVTMNEMATFAKQVNAAIVDPAFISTVNKK